MCFYVFIIFIFSFSSTAMAWRCVLWAMIFQGIIADLKIWVPTTSLTDKGNWANGLLPKECDTISLVNAVDLTLKVPESTVFHIQSLTLPRKGILKFGVDALMTFTDKKKCSGKNNKPEFMRQTVKGWLDPDNWAATTNPFSEGWIPHRDRIPCAGDAVAFGQNLNTTSSHTVMLPSVLVPIGAITNDQKLMTTSEWSEFLQSEKGYENFKGPAAVRALEWRTDTGCVNEKLCSCGRGAYAIRDWSYIPVESSVLDEAVCLYASPKCEYEEILCHLPVYPQGHCCGVCGALVNINDRTANGIPLKSVTAIVRALVKETGYNVKFYVGRLDNGNIQVSILSKNGDSADSYQLALDLKSRLKQAQIGDYSVSLTSSGWSKKYNPVSSIFGTLFGPLFFVLFLFGLMYTAINVLPKQKWLQMRNRDPFTFARFRNTLQEAASQDTLVLETERPTSDSFANPLFNAENINPATSFVDDALVEHNNDCCASTREDTEKLIQLDDIKKNDLEMKEDDACVDSQANDDESDDVSFSQLREQPDSSVLDEEKDFL